MNFPNQKEWTRRGSNPGPSACEADVIPLHHKPVMTPGAVANDSRKTTGMTSDDDILHHFPVVTNCKIVFERHLDTDFSISIRWNDNTI